MPLPEYRYGKVEGLLPHLTVVTERIESPFVCCGYAAAQMASITARAGVSNSLANEGHRMRALGGRPHNHGSKASEVRKGAFEALEVTLKDVPKADIPDRLRDGYAVVVGLQYAELPRWLRVQTNDFGHSPCLYGWDERLDAVGYFDPLWSQGAAGAWVPWATLRPSLWPDGNHSTTVERQADMAGDFVLYAAETESRKRGHMAPGKPFFNDSSLKVMRGHVGPSGAKPQVFGYHGVAYAVSVLTAQGYADGVARETMVFVKKADVTGIVTTPLPECPECPPPVEPGPPDTAARDAQWEQALKHGDPWPSA